MHLYRNLEGIPFPSKAGETQLQEVQNAVAKALGKRSIPGFTSIDLEALNPMEQRALSEKQVIAAAVPASVKFQGVWVKKDGKIMLTVNEEDHLTLKVNLSGFQLEEGWKTLNELDDKLEKHLTYAFSKDLGYLTANPTKIGTALRVAVTLHLPGLVLSGVLNKLVPHIQQLSLGIKAFQEDDAPVQGNIYQIFNQITLGAREEDIMEKLSDIAQQIIDQEKAARANLEKDSRVIITDKVWRCYGVLKHARLISLAEALERISMVRLGVDLGFLPQIPTEVFNKLLLEIQPAHLQLQYGETPEGVPLDEIRAKHVRERLDMAKGASRTI